MKTPNEPPTGAIVIETSLESRTSEPFVGRVYSVLRYCSNQEVVVANNLARHFFTFKPILRNSSDSNQTTLNDG